MRLRIIIMILALLAFVSASAGGLLYYHSFKKAAFQKTEADVYSRLTLLSDQLSTYLSEYSKPVKTLSEIKELKRALKSSNLETIFQANQILDIFAKNLSVETCYLMDKNGITLCSSNRNNRDSFVGHDFSFRPYYKKAILKKASTYLALGTTSQKRGVYYSHPVYDTDQKNIIGVAVIKASAEYVEKKLFPESDDILMFTSPDGLIFISNHKDLTFKFLWSIAEKEKYNLINSRQFGNGPWDWSGFTIIQNDYVKGADNTRYLFYSLNVANYPGWKIINLKNYESLQKQVSKPFTKILGPVILSILILTGFLVIILYQMGSQEISRRKKAEKELRLNEERYRHIYHKTPVMLHSIDTQGNIIRVSDHWLEVMGYQRNDVIGKQLTDFFTPKSKQFAIDVVFPEFFSTGFCKNIPYTYIKKNNETIDVMLSCYGVRNEDNEIVRSLAVSVDVTEKNQTQKELQIATEKLSLYSHDLEKQVKKRTAQLENSQKNLKKLSTNVIASQEREKAQMARELHDHLGQVLTALRIDAVWISSFLNTLDNEYLKDKKAETRAKKMCTLIDDTINDVRGMAYRLRPRVLDDLGLTDALESMLTDFEKRSNVSCVFRHKEIPDIDDTLSTALYRIGQEAVTNALKHSDATTITVELTPDNEGIVLIIKDDGCGFNIEAEQNSEGFGIEGMKERANLVGGKLEIASRLSEGTVIYCKVKVKG